MYIPENPILTFSFIGLSGFAGISFNTILSVLGFTFIKPDI